MISPNKNTTLCQVLCMFCPKYSYGMYNPVSPLEMPTNDWLGVASLMKFENEADYRKYISRLRLLPVRVRNKSPCLVRRNPLKSQFVLCPVQPSGFERKTSTLASTYFESAIINTFAPISPRSSCNKKATSNGVVLFACLHAFCWLDRVIGLCDQLPPSALYRYNVFLSTSIKRNT